MFAQHGRGRENKAERAKMRAERLAQELQLTAEQKTKVEALFTDEEKKLQEIISQEDKTVKQIKEEVRALRTQTNDEIRNIVGPEKYTQYESWLQNSKAERRLRQQVDQEEAGIDYQSDEEIRQLKRERRNKEKGNQ